MVAALDGSVLVETEAGFQLWITDLAKYNGWSVHFTLRSKGSPAGWPDLILIRPPRFVVAEVKRASGRLTPAQRKTIAQLLACDIETYVWKPADRPAIERILARR